MADKFILDTCTFLWLANDPDRVPLATRDLISQPESEVYLSIVSVWEIALKESLGVLTISHPLEEFISSSLEVYQFELLPLQVSACAQLRKLPTPHKDPFDRMLICQTILLGAILVSPDKFIREYPVRVVW